jgi:hypothetical protein
MCVSHSRFSGAPPGRRCSHHHGHLLGLLRLHCSNARRGLPPRRVESLGSTAAGWFIPMHRRAASSWWVNAAARFRTRHRCLLSLRVVHQDRQLPGCASCCPARTPRRVVFSRVSSHLLEFLPSSSASSFTRPGTVPCRECAARFSSQSTRSHSRSPLSLSLLASLSS